MFTLKNHPFPVEAFFKSSVVLTFAIAKEQVENLLPQCLQPDTFQKETAFIAVAMVQTKDLRPKGTPKILGNDFFLVGYRVFVTYTTQAGKRLRGLYILKSETDKRKMQWLGNLFTHYNYTTTDISVQANNDIIKYSSIQSDFSLSMSTKEDADIPLPPKSPFSNWKEARRFAGPLPFTFTFDANKSEVLIIEGVRENWIPQPLKVISYNFEFLDNLGISDMRLANAFIVKNIPYTWQKGRIEKWVNR